MSIAPALVVLAVVASPSVPSGPTLPAFSIWGTRGFRQIATYSTTRPGPYESSIEIVKGSGSDPDSGPEKMPELERGTMILMIISGERSNGADSVQEAVGVTFELDLTPIAASTDYGQHWRAIHARQGETFYDGLPIWLLGFDLRKAATFETPMYATMLSQDPTKAKPVTAKIQILGPSSQPSETSHGGLEVEVSYEGKVDELWFDPGPSHVLLAWKKADGNTLTLKSNRRE